MKKKILFVVQRYGLEVNGGAELHCRQLAERLKDEYDVSVLTTCAIDYVTWKNEYKEGIEHINGVKVIRKKVDFERNQKKFNKISLPTYPFATIKHWKEKCIARNRMARSSRSSFSRIDKIS